jgi:hypothetical protein
LLRKATKHKNVGQKHSVDTGLRKRVGRILIFRLGSTRGFSVARFSLDSSRFRFQFWPRNSESRFPMRWTFTPVGEYRIQGTGRRSQKSSVFRASISGGRMPSRKCPLCLQVKPIVKSHLMPAQVYGYCRPPGGHPISVSSRIVIASDRQLQTDLLCLECEDVLNKGGEMWLLPLLARYEGSFPSYDLLLRTAPMLQSKTSRDMRRRGIQRFR